MTLLKIFKINGQFKSHTAHIKISRTRNKSFDMHILLDRGIKRIERIYCTSFTEDHSFTIKQDCIAALQKNIPSEITHPTEVYFEGKLLFRLLPAK